MKDERAKRARLRARANLTKWCGFERGYGKSKVYGGEEAMTALMKLFGYAHYRNFADMTEEDPDLLNKVEMLSGPHGYAVYRALLAKRQP